MKNPIAKFDAMPDGRRAALSLAAAFLILLGFGWRFFLWNHQFWSQFDVPTYEQGGNEIERD